MEIRLEAHPVVPSRGYIEKHIHTGAISQIAFVPCDRIGDFDKWHHFMTDDLGVFSLASSDIVSKEVPPGYVGARAYLVDEIRILQSCEVFVKYLHLPHCIEFTDFASYCTMSLSFLQRTLITDGVYTGPRELPSTFVFPNHLRSLGYLRYVRGELDLRDTLVTDFGFLEGAQRIYPPRTMTDIVAPWRCAELVIDGPGPPVTRLVGHRSCSLDILSRVVLDVSGLKTFKNSDMGHLEGYAFLLRCPLPEVLSFDYGSHPPLGLVELRDFRLKGG